jgi:NADH dehydrogenase
VILVAGGTGRLGTLIVDRLTSRGLDVRVLTRDPRRAAHLAGRAEVVTGDVRDAVAVAAAVAGVEVVVSAIQGFVGPGGVSPATVDREGNANLTDAAKAADADLVLMSIVGAAADSAMELHRMKHAAEQYAMSRGVPTTVVRASAFVELWVDLLRQTAARSGRPLVFGQGDNPLNFVSVRDVAALVDQVVTDPGSRGKILEIGGPDNLSFNQLARAVQTADGRTGSPRHVPPAMLRLTANTIGRFKPQLARQTRAALAMDRTDLTFDATPIRQIYPNLPNTSLTDVFTERDVE